MQNSAKLGLAYVAPQQSQKHVTVNEAFRRLDMLVQASVRSRTLAAQPAGPADGDAYILPAGKTGADWAVMSAGAIAAFQDGAWTEFSPREGWRVWVDDENLARSFDGAAWVAESAGGSAQSAPFFGVNTTADTLNRLAVKSDTVLFSHDDVTPGSGDHRLKVNKAASAKTGSVLFQTNASGRAEFGCVGDDQFRLKVSADGATWKDAFVIDGASGNVGVGASPGANQRLFIRGMNVVDNDSGDLHIQKENFWTLMFLDTFSGTAGHSGFSIQRRARGSIAAPAAVQNGDGIGGFSFRAYAPSGAFVQTALIYTLVDAAPSGASVPTAMGFYTGTTGAVERLRITSAGNVGIGMASPAVKLDIDGPARVKSYTVAGVPAASAGAGQIIFVSNETGGAVLAFSDGTNWRRVTDRAVVS